MGVRLRASAITLAAAFATACTTYGNGDGYGYGYGGVSVGFATGYHGGYYDPWYGAPYWGWYGDYYYPGIGFYVYDTGGHRHHWDDDTRRHWTSRRDGWRGRIQDGDLRENWRDFARNRRVADRTALTDRQALRVGRGTGDVRGGRRTLGEAQAGGSPTVTNRIRSDRSAVRGDQVGRQSFRGSNRMGGRSFRGGSRPSAGFRSSRPD